MTGRALPLTGKILLLALAYILAGRLALLLAIPPGFATAIFPPVGIALAAVLIWGRSLLLGVFLGSSLLNLSIAVDSLGQVQLSNLLVACGIALGSTLQCLCASLLVQRLPGFPNPLTDERSVFLLLLLGGPLSCLISASSGPLVLYLAGVIPGSAWPFSFWTWWVGDSIGVLIATPLMFILFAKPRSIWSNRLGTVGLPLLVSCVLVVVAFIRASSIEQEDLRASFQSQARVMASTLKFRLELYSLTAEAIERLFLVSSTVSRQDFSLFTENLPQSYPGIQALEWCPQVPHSQRGAFEALQQREGLADYRIREKTSSGQLVAAATREFYVPVSYAEPQEPNRLALGFDLTSEPTRRLTLLRAQASPRTVMSAPIILVQDQLRQPGFLLVRAVHRDAVLQGYALAVVRVTDLVDAALSHYPRDGFHLQLTDLTDAQPQSLFSEGHSRLPDYANALVWTEEFQLGGRQLQLQISPSQSFLLSSHSLQPWLVLAGGLLMSALLGGFLLTITGRAEQVRSQVRQRTLELSAILENAAEAILIFDSDGQIISANPAAAQLFGTLWPLPGQDISRLLPSLDLNDQEQLQRLLEHSCELSGAHADGQSLELEISLSHYALAERQRFICLLRDISARKQVERLKNEFVATVSHELRTPLTSIKGSLGLLNAGVIAPLPEQARELLGIAHSNVERLCALVNDILDIEKLEFGQDTIALTPHPLAALLQQAVALNQGYADNYGVRLQLDISALTAQHLVLVEPQRLQQVMANLISNAVKFSPANARVLIRANLQGNQLRVSISDQGLGIPDEFRSRIFHKFAQADSSDTRQQGGTGLGLSICKTLIERMHGQIGYTSTSGIGTTFHFDLPAA